MGGADEPRVLRRALWLLQRQLLFPGQERGFGGGGVKRLFIHAADGRLIGAKVPWEGTGADLFMQLQFPVHSGRMLGLPGRILISLTGLVVAALSITGVVIWLRNRRAMRVRPAT